MRVLIGSESFYPNISGVAVTTFNLASYLARRGHEVAVMVPSPRYRNFSESFPEGFTVLRVASVWHPFRKGFRVTVYPLSLARRVVREWRPDIVHLQDPTSIGSALLKACREEKIPVVISHHFTLEYVLAYLWFLRPFHGFLRRKLTSAMVKFYNQCRHVICPSETVRRDLLAAGVAVPVTAISNGVDLDRFFAYEPPLAVRLAFHLPAKPIVLYVGRMDPDKSLDTLIKAMPLILARHDVHFVLCGTGNLREKFERWVRKDGLAPHVTFLGPFANHSENLPRLYQLATCFVIPSGIESQSIVTLEAMASGLPIVAARAGALPELVTDGENGFLFKLGDPEDLAAKVNLLLADEELRKLMGKKSLEKVVAHKLEASMARIEEIYHRVVRNGKA
ncbi:glycosyl transferase group 1 [Ammonifex degensii KC4]|uniref:Glycosyl transferase group 1 n=2 Tax=Ammonifex degensii TaxID=42838 RepID=C9R7W8_AMMDK|nr:glycosyl transferase group 1 [Ammonifex degensii KC4]